MADDFFDWGDAPASLQSADSANQSSASAPSPIGEATTQPSDLSDVRAVVHEEITAKKKKSILVSAVVLGSIAFVAALIGLCLWMKPVDMSGMSKDEVSKDFGIELLGVFCQLLAAIIIFVYGLRLSITTEGLSKAVAIFSAILFLSPYSVILMTIMLISMPFFIVVIYHMYAIGMLALGVLAILSFFKQSAKFYGSVSILTAGIICLVVGILHFFNKTPYTIDPFHPFATNLYDPFGTDQPYDFNMLTPSIDYAIKSLTVAIMGLFMCVPAEMMYKAKFVDGEESSGTEITVAQTAVEATAAASDTAAPQDDFFGNW